MILTKSSQKTFSYMGFLDMGSFLDFARGIFFNRGQFENRGRKILRNFFFRIFQIFFRESLGPYLCTLHQKFQGPTSNRFRARAV